jgi:hypothetical protein
VVILAGSLILVRPPRATHWLPAVAAFLGIISIQLVVNLASGHGLLETAQAFNVHKLLYGISWTEPPSPAVIRQFSLLDAIRSDPQHFFETYFPYFQALAWFAYSGALCFLLAPSASGARLFGVFAALAVIVYAIPLAMGDSPRAPLTVAALFIAPTFVAAAALLTRARASAPASLLIGALMIAGTLYLMNGWMARNLSLIQANAAQHANFLLVQDRLVDRGLSSTDEVFSDKYQLYLPDVLPFQPRQIGGWSQDWLVGYAAEYPELPNESWEAFSRACRAQGIRFLVLSPAGEYQGAFFRHIYNRDFDEELLGLEFIGVRAKMRMYRFTDGSAGRGAS